MKMAAPADLLFRVVSAAVSPVVLISADAVLILGVNTKHAALADRARNMAGEYRRAACTPERRAVIGQQLLWFRRRLRYAAAAHLWLYASTACFIATILVLAATRRAPTSDEVGLLLLGAGVALMFGAVAAETLELRLASRTLRCEWADIAASAPAGPVQAREPSQRR